MTIYSGFMRFVSAVEQCFDWALNVKPLFRALAIFLVVGGYVALMFGITFIAVCVAIPRLWSVSTLLGGMIGCSLGSGIVSACIYWRKT